MLNTIMRAARVELEKKRKRKKKFKIKIFNQRKEERERERKSEKIISLTRERIFSSFFNSSCWFLSLFSAFQMLQLLRNNRAH